MVLGEATYVFRGNVLGASFYFIVIMTLKRSISSYFRGGLSFVFSIVEGNGNIFYIEPCFHVKYDLK